MAKHEMALEMMNGALGALERNREYYAGEVVVASDRIRYEREERNREPRREDLERLQRCTELLVQTRESIDALRGSIAVLEADSGGGV